MKRKITAFFCALCLLAGVLPARAAGPAGGVEMRFYNEREGRYEAQTEASRVNVTLNGEEMALDVPAVIRTVQGNDGRTMVPVRPIAEALGATVRWMGESRQVAIISSTESILLTLGSGLAEVNGELCELPGGVPADVASYGGADRTMVPLRFVSEQLHAQVEWDNKTYTAHVTAQLPGEEAEDKHLLRIAADENAQDMTFFLDAPPDYRVIDLGDRVVIDLPGFVLWEGDGSIPLMENPVVERVRFAQHGDDLYEEYANTARVVLDLKEGCTYRNVTVQGDPDLWAVNVTVQPPGTGAELPTGPDENWDPSAFVVALDAGHGGSASGAVYEDIEEKTITLPVTLRVAELLRERGYNVVLTRNRDVYMDLYDRCDIANNVGADIFVSIHANASVTNRDFMGTFTYSYPDSVEGERLAGCIQDAVVASAGSIDRGLLTNDYVVLRETNMPAALLEMGFMSCHEELQMLIQPEYQEKIAQGVARGVEIYLATKPEKREAAEQTEQTEQKENGGEEALQTKAETT
ncbi:MAG: AMIN domain-containing protein [Oscillospiraceae bacterium]|nr:AMIN domain-containing protein [Oscillospiraceae bacterium]